MSILGIWGPPQSGKTTIAIALATALARQGKIVCLISAEDYAEMPITMGVTIPAKKGLKYALSGDKKVKDFVVEVETNLFLLAPSIYDSAFDYTLTGDQAERLLNSAADVFDYLVVDCTAEKQALTGQTSALAKKMIIPVPARVCAKAWFDANERLLTIIAPKTEYVRSCTSKDFAFSELEKSIGCKTNFAIPYCKNMPVLVSEAKSFFDNGGKKARQTFLDLAEEVTHHGK